MTTTTEQQKQNRKRPKCGRKKTKRTIKNKILNQENRKTKDAGPQCRGEAKRQKSKRARQGKTPDHNGGKAAAAVRDPKPGTVSKHRIHWGKVPSWAARVH